MPQHRPRPFGDFAASAAATTAARCSACTMIPAPLRAEVEQLYDRDHAAPKLLYRWLREEHGITTVSQHSLFRHLRRTCTARSR